MMLLIVLYIGNTSAYRPGILRSGSSEGMETSMQGVVNVHRMCLFVP